MKSRRRGPLELLYADSIVLIVESMEEFVEKFKKWKKGLEELRVNATKLKVMISSIKVK